MKHILYSKFVRQVRRGKTSEIRVGHPSKTEVELGLEIGMIVSREIRGGLVGPERVHSLFRQGQTQGRRGKLRVLGSCLEHMPGAPRMLPTAVITGRSEDRRDDAPAQIIYCE